MKGYYPYINILVMPTDICNMSCIYCFHKNFNTSTAVMNLETLENLMKITLPYYEKVGFIWHGGEPLVMGLDFFKEVVKIQNKYNRQGLKITNRMQTNLTLMDEQTAEYLVENGFGIGSSYDGIHNEVTRGNSDKILNGRELLLSCGSKCGMISVVSDINVNSLIESYEFCKSRNIDFTLNMYIKTCNNEISRKLELDKDTYVKNITELFDYWLYDKGCNINISYFNTYLEYIFGRRKTLCTYTSCLGKWLGVRFNGDITPCNRYFPDEYIFGNVNELSSIGKAFDTQGFRTLLTKAIQRRDKCKACRINDFCNGGCNNVAYNTNGIENNGGLYCESQEEIYIHIEEAIFSIDKLKYSRINPKARNLFRKYNKQYI